MPPELTPLEAELLAFFRRQDENQERRHQEQVAALKEHNNGAQTRHSELLKALNQRDGATAKAIKELAEEDRRWQDQLVAGLKWLGPKLWELLRTPVGTLVLGALLLQLARVLDIAPMELLQALGPSPIPVQTVEKEEP